MPLTLERPKLTLLGEVVLLPSLILYLFGWPFVQGIGGIEQHFEGAVLVVVVFAAGTATQNRVGKIAALGFGAISFLADTLSDDRVPFLEGLSVLSAFLFSISVAAVLLISIFGRTNSVTWRVVLNVFSVYLIIGFAFANLYELAGFGLSSLNHSYGFDTNIPDFEQFTTTYFSFVTLTTLGYGDIVPTDARIAGIAIVEVLLGQLYLATVVARFVSLLVAEYFRDN